MPTKICKLCFKPIKNNSIVRLINNDLSLCPVCYKRLNPQFVKFTVLGYSALAFYYYDDDIKSLLYQLKGCFDYELSETFLDRYFKEIRLKYVDYYLVPIPSFFEDDEKRQFNHVEEIFKCLKLRTIKALSKTSHFKQASHNSKQREEINKHLIINEGINLSGKKILVVDDVYTTGSTMKAAIKLLEKLHPKKIKILVMAKTKNLHNYNQSY